MGEGAGGLKVCYGVTNRVSGTSHKDMSLLAADLVGRPFRNRLSENRPVFP